MLRKGVSALGALLLAGTVCAQGVLGGQHSTTPHFDPARISQDIQILSSDAFEGRGPATPAETKTIHFLEAQFKAAGLTPGGDPDAHGKRAWTQSVPLLQSSFVSAPEVTLKMGDVGKMLVQGNEIALRAPLDGSKHLALVDVPLVFVGYGVTAPEKNWDDFKGLDVHGKLLVVLINDPDYETGEGDFGGKAMTYYGRWTYKYGEAARRGAAGMLIVHETGPASYGWATVKNSNINTMFDIVRDDPAAVHPPIEAWIQRDLAVALFKGAGLDFETLKKQAQSRDFQPVPLRATLSVKADAAVSQIVSHNVVGRIVGRTAPDDTVLYSAHWDHLGIGPPDARGDRIYNGAVDNASGTAALIAMGRAFAHGPKPQRSVVFLSVTAEEKGLLGSEYYATHPLYPLGTTVGVLNMDGIDVNGPARNFSISGNARLGLLDDLIAEGRKAGRVFTPEAHPEAGSFFRSDHFSFAKQGVPAISFKGGSDLVQGGLAKGEALEADYTKYRYHQPADEWRADWDLRGAAQDLELLYALGQHLADSREWPDWDKSSEFRAKRDETAGMRR